MQNKKNKIIYTVATAHLDTSWHWPLETTIAEYLPKTLEDNFALFKKYPNYTFSFEGAYRYALAEEYYPELFKELQTYITQGRWRVAGSAWENGDVNLPSPEALMRNFLFGNRYFCQKCGATSCDVFLPDCFGFGAALPGVAAHMGLKGFVTQKLTWGSAGRVPFALGCWQGPDGSKIFACPDAHNYAAAPKSARRHFAIRLALRKSDRALLLHGVGDQGGAPNEASVRVMCAEAAQTTPPQTKCAGSDDIFRDLAALPAAQRATLPLYKGEWLLSDHGTGCYTARTWSKRWNRKAEQLAFAAETAGAFACFLGRQEYPRAQLNAAWQRIITHQFHDDITGTSNEISYRRNWNDLMVSQKQFCAALHAAAGCIAHTLGTRFAMGRCVAVLNLTQWERRESIALRLPQPLQNSRVRVLDEYGRETPAQRSADGTHVVITPALPPMRVSLFDVQLSAGPTPKNALRITKSTLENENLQVKIDKNGDISSLYDKRLSREMLRKPVRLALFRFDGSPFWPQWELQYSALRRRPAYAAQPQINVLEAGPARVALEITRQARGSTFRQVLSLDAGGTWLRVANEIDWQSPRTLLKIEIPTAASNACATYDLGFGTARRKTNTARQYEVPAQQWADLTDRDGGFGLSVLSDCKAGWDKPDRHTLRLTAVFSPRAGHRGNAAQLDFGRDRFDFALFSHAGGWQNGAVQAGACFNQPLPAYWIPAASPTASPAPAKNEPFGAVGGHIILRALKQAEDGDDWIARLQETDGTPLPEGTLRLGGGILAFREVNGAEEDHHPKNCAVLCGTTLHASFNPYEIRTFRLQVAPMPHAAPLPRPQTLSFEAAPQICGGQTLTINRPHGDAAWLQLAIACKGKDRDTVFLAGGRPHTRRVYSMTEPIAAGDLPGIGVSGYTKPAVPLEEFLRVPGETGDAKPGAQVWFHEVALPFNGKAATLTLPRDNNIVLLWVRVHSTPAVVPANALLDQMERRPVPAVLPAQAPKQRLRALRYRLHQAKNFARHFCEVHFSQKD